VKGRRVSTARMTAMTPATCLRKPNLASEIAFMTIRRLPARRPLTCAALYPRHRTTRWSSQELSQGDDAERRGRLPARVAALERKLGAHGH
jgi:hypothetical protein